MVHRILRALPLVALCAAFISATVLAAEPRKYESDPYYRSMTTIFGRGVNLGNALEALKEGDWGVTIKAEYLTKIKEAGFTTVRIPVRWSGHAEDTSPYTIQQHFIDRVDNVVQMALRNHLIPIVNMHNYDGLVHQPDDHKARFVGLWKQIAEHFKSAPPALTFELFNEPNSELTAEKWNAIIADTVAEIRKTNPTRRIIVGPVAWNGISELANLRLPPGDKNLVVTVHYYSPFHFTHQGADWVGNESKTWLGTKWLGTPPERAEIDHDFDTAVGWAVKHKVPILLGEFGAYSKADMPSRAKWTKYVVDAAMKRKMSFTYWEFCSGFGVYDPVKNEWNKPIKDALLGSKATK